MRGLMQDWPLTVDRILEHANRWHSQREIVTRSVEGPIVRTTYGQVYDRSKRLSNALQSLGVGLGDRVATLAWNTARHLENWYGIMGIGAICHTINPRLFAEQLVYIINHAEDRIIFTDLSFVSTLEGLIAQCPSVEHVVVLTDEANMVPFRPQGVPHPAFKGALCYETLLAGARPEAQWGGFDEHTAAGLCYTSGTTGNPKGVLYSHRSNFLHTFSGLGAEVLALTVRDVALPVVPLFHANAWGLAFDAPAVGAKLVMPGAKMDGASIHELMETEGVTFSAGVPTVWQMLLAHMQATPGARFSTLKRIVVGGSACPDAIMRGFNDYGVEVLHAWGMTETSPVGVVNTLTPELAAMPFEEQLPWRMKQGRPPIGVDLKLTDDAGNTLPNDGHTFGRLKVRGPFIAKSYFKGEGGYQLDMDGFFDTGDVATIDADGFMTITDRAKDVIKSGGEWISSIEIENIAAGYPKTAIATVVGVPHPKWDERPLLVVKLKPGETATREEYLGFLEGKIAKFWMPDDVVFVDEIPLGATGKIDKKVVRKQFESYVLPGVAAAGAAAVALAASKPPTVYASEDEAPAPDAGMAPEPDVADEPAPPEEPVVVEPAAEIEAPQAEPVAESPAEEPSMNPEAENPFPFSADPPEPEPVPAEEPAPEPEPAPLAYEPIDSPVAMADEGPLSVPISPKRKKRENKFAAGVLDLFLFVAIIPVVLVIVGALMVRFGLVDWNIGYGDVLVGRAGDMSWAFKAALAGAVTGVLGLFVALFGGVRRLGRRAFFNLALTVATLGAFFYLNHLQTSVPPLHDVATDWGEPLTFSEAVMAERGQDANPVDLDPTVPIETQAFAGRRVAELNAEHCPLAKPLVTPLAPAAAYAQAKTALTQAGLDIRLDDPANGKLEAVATTPVYGFKDDVAVRVRQDVSGSRIDIRSISRERQADMGANCRRVTSLLGALGG